jgi:acid phosphatase family membrane protein YuiD
MDFANLLFSNKFITIPALAWFIAQAAKVVISLAVSHKLDLTRLFGTGGMPSSHSAYVVTLATIVGKNVGVDSAAFGITLAFSLVVMTDAAGVRRAAGKQAKLLNSLMSTHFPGDAFNEKLKELLGHKPLEVLVGAIFGLAMGMVIG